MAESLQGASQTREAEARWYACYTRARHEKQVDTLLKQRGIESFLPLIPRERQWKDRRKVVELPLFPSYVFSRVALADMHHVLSVPGVATIVKVNGAPVSIPEEELENVRRFAAALRTGGVEVETAPYIAEGQWVEVVTGPLAGVRGRVVERRSRRRVLIGIEAIGQGLEVNIDTGALRPIPEP